MTFTQLKKHRNRVGLGYFLLGAFVGFLVSSLLSMLSWSHRQENASTAVNSWSKQFKEQNGWSLIHVFYGNTSHIQDASFIEKESFEARQWFSQTKQDLVVSTLLRSKRNGYFVDLASNDAIRISNTYALETYFGWRGLCLEPNPLYWPGLSYRKCDVAAAVVGKKSMEEVLFKYPNRAPTKGGIVAKEFDNKFSSKFNEDHLRFTVTLSEIFERFNTPRIIDYLSLDVEGAEEFIMEAFPFADYQFNVLTVERPSKEFQKLLESNNYIILKTLKAFGETLWIHRSMEKMINRSALDIDTTEKYRAIPGEAKTAGESVN